MTHNIKNTIDNTSLAHRAKNIAKKALLASSAGLVLACASCAESGPSCLQQVPVTDTAPIGEGLKLIGYAILGFAVLGVLGRLIR